MVNPKRNPSNIWWKVVSSAVSNWDYVRARQPDPMPMIMKEKREGRKGGRKEREGKTTTNKDAFVRVAEIFVATFPVF